MIAYNYGEPRLFGWIKAIGRWGMRGRRWSPRRLLSALVIALVIATCLPLAWVCVKVGTFGHWIAYGALGHDSREHWE